MDARPSNILGISAYYHDSADALMRDGKLVAAAQEERFSRKKHDPRFPRHAIRYCLEAHGLAIEDLDRVVFYDKPLVKFERLLETYLNYAPHGIRSFLAAMPVWLKEKVYLKTTLRKELAELGSCTTKNLPPLLFAEQHQSHAASAFCFSPFEPVLSPTALRPIYRGWMKFGLLASKVTTPLILGSVFFLLICPMGIIRGALGKNGMRRPFRAAVASYRVTSSRKPAANLERSF